MILLLACGLNPEPKDSDPSDTDGGTGSGALSIAQVRGGDYVDGDAVSLEGVVVTSPLTRDAEGFFIQDPAGGPRSGLYVWMQVGFTEAPAQRGDIISISGVLSEYYDWTELVISDTASITVTSTGSLPEPADLGDGAGVSWDDYESMLVKLSDQTVESVDEYNTGLLTAGINFDDGFQYNEFDWGGHYDWLQGIVFYQYEEWSINNRDDDDLGPYTPPAATTVTVADVQQGLAGGPVALEGVVVTSAVWGDDGEGTFFVQDAGGGAWSGVAVYASDFTPSVAVGDVIDLSGEVQEYYSFTEISVSADTDIVVTGSATPTADPLTEAAADWEMWEGCLLELRGVEATSEQSYGQVLTNFGIYVDDLFYDFEATTGSSWASVTGPLYFTSYDDVAEWKVEPRSAADFVE